MSTAESREIQAITDCVWYQLATLHGIPEKYDFELKQKNCDQWNRYAMSNLAKFQREYLITHCHLEHIDITPPSGEELRTIEDAFRRRSPQHSALPAWDMEIDFSSRQLPELFDMSGFIFPRAVNFSHCRLGSDTGFANSIFLSRLDFTQVECQLPTEPVDIAHRLSDPSIISRGHLSFSGCRFFGVADFSKTDFPYADFSWSFFHLHSRFNKTRFYSGISFESTLLAGADFSGSQFHGAINFSSARFSAYSSFSACNFHEKAVFYGAHFQDANFIDAEFLGKTSFYNAVFHRSPPEFFGATLHESTDWRGVLWPSKPSFALASDFMRSYERLRLEMDRLKKHEDELDFFAKELQCRQVLLGSWRGLAIAAFEGLSDYGRSYTRPLLWLIYTIVASAILFAPHFSRSEHVVKDCLAVSIANTFSLLGFRKELVPSSTFDSMPLVLLILSGLQTIVGAVLIFLIALAFRNKFRLK